MARMNQTTGFETVKKNLLKAMKQREEGIERGLIVAGAFLLRESQLLAPTDIGHLYGGGFVRPDGAGAKTIVTVGYTADYAVFVHEDLNKLHGADFNAAYYDRIKARGIRAKKGKKLKSLRFYHSRRPEEQAKFLERPMREKRDEIFSIIAIEAKGGGR